MGDLKNNFFYNELSKEKQKEFFHKTRDKIYHNIDNLYYSVYLNHDVSERSVYRQIFADPEYFYELNHENFALNDYADLFYLNSDGVKASLGEFCKRWDEKKKQDKFFYVWERIDELIEFLDSRHTAAKRAGEAVSLSRYGGSEIGLKLMETGNCANFDPDVMDSLIEQIIYSRQGSDFDSYNGREYLRQCLLEEKEFMDLNLFISRGSNKNFTFILSDGELFDILISRSLRNSSTPRVQVQLRSKGLWLMGVKEMIESSYGKLVRLLNVFGLDELDIKRVMENRVDYCYHTNIFENPDKFLDDAYLCKYSRTVLTPVEKRGRRGRYDKKTDTQPFYWDYFACGSRKSDNVFVRVYNKTREVINMGYKIMFFDIWHKNGLINFYDKWCYEYVFNMGVKNFDYIHMAKLYFYMEYGSNADIKQKIGAALIGSDSTNADFKALCDVYMPELTTVVNIEYETKRKFYSYSDEQIDCVLETKDKNAGGPLKRLFKITDNRQIFLDYLTSETFSFKQNNGQDYVWWWERLRNVKTEGLKTDRKLIRNYDKNINKNIVFRRIISGLSTLAAIDDDCLTTGFEYDFTKACGDFSNLNDNDKQCLTADYNRKKIKKAFAYKSYKKSENENFVFKFGVGFKTKRFFGTVLPAAQDSFNMASGIEPFSPRPPASEQLSLNAP